VPVFCIHKGLPIPAFSTRYNDPRDIGVVAKAYPNASFVVYHSAYGHQNALYTEGPYQAGSRVGVNALITSLMENNIGPGSNVYAELGTTWQLVTTTLSWGSLDGAAHVIGKLLKYVGEDNVVWGTDSVWYGSPQQQIEMFLQFQISPQFQQQFAYPALTMELKRKILGLNSAKIYGLDVNAVRCAVDKGKLAQQKRALDGELGGRRWAFLQPPLRTRRDFVLFHRQNGFRPG
jgi:predicted TIM-barrel fold metal-dependent hydrolase